ncbi:hypothetical protein RhiJN_10110 [Ceratobasidium sp. AG-Ba]|nr:hypothetical protein RhiJN_10110 [Ceratobasidium sp. AG-Ba]
MTTRSLATNPTAFHDLRDTLALFSELLPSSRFNFGYTVEACLATWVSSSNGTMFVLIRTHKKAGGIFLLVVRQLNSRNALFASLFHVDGETEAFRKPGQVPYLYLMTAFAIRDYNWSLIPPTKQVSKTRRALNLKGRSTFQPAHTTAVIGSSLETNNTSKTTSRVRQTFFGFVRFIFGIDEIKTTAASIRAMISACLTCAEKHVDKLSPIIVKKLDKLEVTLRTIFDKNAPTLDLPVRPHRPSISKRNRTSSYSVPSTLPNNITPCIDPIHTATTNILVFFIQTLRETNLFSIREIAASLVILVGSLLVALCQRTRTVAHSRLTNGGRALLEALRSALFTPISSWKAVGMLPRKRGWTIRPLDVIAFILAFLINLASCFVEGGIPGRITAFNYKTSLDSNLKDPVSIAAFVDARDYIGISINIIKVIQIPTDIFAEPEVPVFGWGELILRIIILVRQLF